jgi:hypothetical protein
MSSMTKILQDENSEKIDENHNDQRNISYWQNQTAVITDEFMKSQVTKESMQRDLDIKNDLILSLKHVSMNEMIDMIYMTILSVDMYMYMCICRYTCMHTLGKQSTEWRMK